MRIFTRDFLIALFLSSLAVLLALSRLNYPLTGIDDANIYFVYARNLANGHGFVYNAGGERVEGFTSLLWTLISALVFKFSAKPELVLLIINIALMSLALASILAYLQFRFPGKSTSGGRKLLWPTIFLTLLITSPRYIAWNTITLMENSLWSALLVMATLSVIGDHSSPRAINLRFVPLSILLLLTRPESMLWVGVFAGLLFIRVASTSNTTIALHALTPSLISIAATLILLTIFRLEYFGYPLPNTYYAKVSPSFTYNVQQGVIYLGKYFISEPIVLLSVIAVFGAGLHTTYGIFSKKIPRDGSFFLPIIAGVGLLLPLLTGGDHFGSFRLYQSIYPIELLCLLYFANRILPLYITPVEHQPGSIWKRRAFRLSLVPVLFFGFFLMQASMWTNSIRSEMNVEFAMADYGRKSGAFIQELFIPLPELPSMGVVTSGGIKYSYDGEIVDLMGLNNTIMAHNPGDRTGIKNHAAFDIDTFHQLQPDIVWPVTIEEGRWQYSESEVKESWENRTGLKGLFDNHRFLELYTYAKVSKKTESNNRYALVAWFKKDFLIILAANPKYLVDEYAYNP